MSELGRIGYCHICGAALPRDWETKICSMCATPRVVVADNICSAEPARPLVLTEADIVEISLPSFLRIVENACSGLTADIQKCFPRAVIGQSSKYIEDIVPPEPPPEQLSGWVGSGFHDKLIKRLQDQVKKLEENIRGFQVQWRIMQDSNAMLRKKIEVLEKARDEARAELTAEKLRADTLQKEVERHEMV